MRDLLLFYGTIVWNETSLEMRLINLSQFCDFKTGTEIISYSAQWWDINVSVVRGLQKTEKELL